MNIDHNHSLYNALDRSIEEDRMDRVEQIMNEFLHLNYVDVRRLTQSLHIAYQQKSPKIMLAIMRSAVMSDFHNELFSSMSDSDPHMVVALLHTVPRHHIVRSAMLMAVKSNNGPLLRMIKNCWDMVDMMDILQVAARLGSDQVIEELLKGGLPAEMTLDALRQALIADQPKGASILASVLTQQDLIYVLNNHRFKSLACVQAVLPFVHNPVETCQMALVGAYWGPHTDIQDYLFEQLAGPTTWGAIWDILDKNPTTLAPLKQRLDNLHTKQILEDTLQHAGTESGKKKM